MVCTKCGGLMYLSYAPDLDPLIDGDEFACRICSFRVYSIPGKTDVEWLKVKNVISVVDNPHALCPCGNPLAKSHKSFCSMSCLATHRVKLQADRQGSLPICRSFSCNKRVPRRKSKYCSQYCRVAYFRQLSSHGLAGV